MKNNFIESYQIRIEKVLAEQFSEHSRMLVQFQQAMCYAVLDGGKRIRPLLVYATGLALGANPENLDIPAVAVELIHCYSLIHDDLPAMDNDELRRGKPTCHKVFGEAIAILAGDALQAHAFTLLASDQSNNHASQIAMLNELGRACGPLGMAGGQAIDLAAAGTMLTLQELETMHRLKTGALIKASVLIGAIVAHASEEMIQHLNRFATHVGLAFQIQDDILDVEGDTEQLGKQQGADQRLNKPTYPAIVGLQKAKQLAQQNYQTALQALECFGEEGDDLRMLAAYMIQRDN